MEWKKIKKLLYEFIRYTIVGGISFLVDISCLIMIYEYVMLKSSYSLYMANIGGFIVGIIVNYVLSVKFVFVDWKDNKHGKSIRSKSIFVLIGIIGLGINEIGMFIGVEKLIIDYRFVKIMMTGLVLIWNYIARKEFVFSIHSGQN